MSKKLWLNGLDLQSCLFETFRPDPADLPSIEVQIELAGSEPSVLNVHDIKTQEAMPAITIQKDVENGFLEVGETDLHQESILKDDLLAALVPEMGQKPAKSSIQVRPAVIGQNFQTKAWPRLDASAHQDLKGVITKFDANVRAIELLRDLQGSAQVLNDDQRKILNRFTGWGGIKDPFDKYPRPEWIDRSKKVQELLSEQEFKSAQSSTLNAHFTPLGVVETIWNAIERYGYKGGRFLETSAGTGYMLGTMPTHISHASEITAIELDVINASILEKLYGDGARVINKGFESVDLPESYFDLVFSNVPFGQYQVPCQRRKPYSNWSIHNYFMGRAIDLVRPGGLVVLITSSYFMDGASDTIRQYISRRAELVHACRLPAGAFAQTASTDVVADVIVLRRREAGAVVSNSSQDYWMELEAPLDEQGQKLTAAVNAKINRYWNDHPQNVLGKLQIRKLQYGEQAVPVLGSEQSLEGMLHASLSSMPENAYQAVQQDARTIILHDGDGSDIPPGSFVLKAGEIYRSTVAGLHPEQINQSRKQRVAGMIAIREALRALVTEQSKKDASDYQLASMRTQLNGAYDRFVAKFGPLADKQNRWAMSSDPSWPLLVALEYVDTETGVVSKAEIFSERTVYPSDMPTTAQTPVDAAYISYSELGVLDEDYMGQLLSKDGKEVIQSLIEEGEAFIDPVTSHVVLAANYLYGNLREKIRIAQAAGTEKFASNIKALTDALPPDLTPAQIDVLPGSIWISTEDYQSFVRDLIAETSSGVSQHFTIEVSHDKVSNQWSLSSNEYVQGPFKSRWGTNRKSFFELYEALLNQVDVTIYDALPDGTKAVNGQETALARMRQEEIKAKFLNWIWKDDDRAQRLCREYNDKFNVWAIQKFDGSRLRLPGYSWALKPRPHQLNAIARIAMASNTLLGHAVGAGKTLELICGSMELRRLGISRKPMHVVPNHLIEQYSAEFLRAYPGARVLMAREQDFEKSNRQVFISRCATGNWDAVVIGHTMFEKIQPDPLSTQSYIEDILTELKAAKEGMKQGDRAAMRALNRQVKDWESKLTKLQAGWKKDTHITFSMTGCDWLFVDEAHAYKNLFRISNMKSVAGLSNSNSQRAFDTFLKCQEIMNLHGQRERGIVFATGTFISNSMAEMHTFQRFLQPYSLQKAGLAAFDAWSAQHGRAVNSLEVAPDGSSFRMTKRYKQFVNIPELMGMFRQVTDIQTKEMLKLPTPPLAGGSQQISVGKPSPELKEYVEKLVERAERIRNRQVSPNEDNMLAVTGDGRMAALDLRLVDASAQFDPSGKIARCVAKVREIWERTASFKGTQIIFSDLGTPTGKSFNVYEDVRKRLVNAGVPREEIAFIHECSNARQKEVLFAKVRAGTVRVLMGSTALCGVGTNVQTRLYAAHHLDCPWRPSDITQRDGRIERQGNTCPEIEIWRYVQEGTFDSYSWQTLTAKAQFTAQVMSGDAEVRSIEDAQMSALSYDEVKALACGNPAVREKASIDAQILGLALKEKAHLESVYSARSRLRNLPYQIKHDADIINRWKEFAAQIQANPQGHDQLIVKGKVFNEMEQIEKVLTLTIAHFVETRDSGVHTMGTFNGVTLVYDGYAKSGFCIYAQDKSSAVSFEIGRYMKGSSITQKVKDFIHELPIHIKQLEDKAEFVRQQEHGLQKIIDSKFEDAQLLNDLRKRSHEISIELGLLKDMEGTQDIGDSEAIESEIAKDIPHEEDDESSEDANEE